MCATMVFMGCSTLGFLGIITFITHKYPRDIGIYRAYKGISHDGVRWDRGTSNWTPDRDRVCWFISPDLTGQNQPTLRILGPSNGGVGTCIAGVRVLKIGTFEGSGYLGYL